ncbi:hypothetical protein HPB51_021437 [Rhipicephalus microplus]|uniref:Tick transposon n=1 Tax=Rhipicephalus microplus TaxID=6941 RepID=A0A9J6DWI5_RHIMP|nr:hypothetical protein HPB51_021437 [Rhipicephalus microplus]
MFLRGALPSVALKRIGETLTQGHATIWCPAHEGISGNALAYSFAQDFSNRVSNDTDNQYEPCTARDILEHQRKTRQWYAPPHKSLNVDEARQLRQSQVNTSPHLERWHHKNPNAYVNQCPWRESRPTLQHVTWDCRNKPMEVQSPLKLPLLGEPWEAVLARPDLKTQRGLLDHAGRAAAATGVLKWGNHP